MRLKTAILIISFVISVFCAKAGEKGAWFVAPTYGVSFVEGEPEFFDDPDGFPYIENHGTQAFSRYGIMGGYLGNWGGYARVTFSESHFNPTITLGATKRLYTFNDTHKSQLHCHLGLGYGYVYGCTHAKLVEIAGVEHPNGPLYQEVPAPREIIEKGSGWAFEGGFIYNNRHVNIGLTYAINTDFFLPLADSEPGSKPNHTLFLSVGYTF